MLLKAMARCEL